MIIIILIIQLVILIYLHNIFEIVEDMHNKKIINEDIEKLRKRILGSDKE